MKDKGYSIAIIIFMCLPILSLITGSMIFVSLMFLTIPIAIFANPILDIYYSIQINKSQKKALDQNKILENEFVIQNNIDSDYWQRLNQAEKNEIINNKKREIGIYSQVERQLLSRRSEIIYNKKARTLTVKNHYSKSENEKLNNIRDLMKSSEVESKAEWSNLSADEKNVAIKKFITREKNAEIKEEENRINNLQKLKEKKEQEIKEKLELQKNEEDQRIIELQKLEIKKINEIERIKLETEEKRVANLKQNEIRRDNQIKEQIKNKILESEKRKRIAAEAVQELLEFGLLDENFNNDKNVREAIPSQVKLAVWHRDKERCVTCNNNKNLEFDHIIPISKGGANTINNIQLLCLNCNRKKSNKIL